MAKVIDRMTMLPRFSSRRVLRSLAFAPLLFQGVVLAEAPQWQLSMKDAELRDVVQEMSSIFGSTVILDPRVQGRITVLSKQPLDREGVRRLFYSVLDAHGFAAVDQGDRLLIIPAGEAKVRAGTDRGNAASANEFVTQVMELNSSVAADLAGLIRPLVSVNGYIGPSVSANALIVTDTAGNVRRISEIVRQLDTGAKNAHAVVELRYGLAAEIAKVMEQSLGKQNLESGSQVIADARSNRLVILGTQVARQRLIEMARALDTPANAQADNSKVIRLRHSDAKQLAEMLDSMSQGLKPVGGSGSSKDLTPATQVVVKADESQNALVVIAEPAQVRTIENIVRQLDQPRAQVLIHAAIVEISGDINEALGVQWGVNGGDVKGGVTFPGAGSTIAGILGSEGNLKLPEGAALKIGSDRFSVLVTALASNARNNLLSTPSLLTLDNQQAEILVGQNVPFKTGSYTTSSSGSDNPFTTVERKDVGISLKIKPHINEGSTLRLEVEQENSEIAPTVSGLSTDDLITNKRSLKSTILADDGEIIVIGGLIKDSVRTVESSVPYLGRIPLIGGLFRSSKDTHTKTNLMVFLRPTIVRSKQNLAEITEDRYNDLRHLRKPGARQNNSLLLPRDPQQLFQGSNDSQLIDLRKDKVRAP